MKFPNDAKLGMVVNYLKNREKIQKDLGSLESRQAEGIKGKI